MPRITGEEWAARKAATVERQRLRDRERQAAKRAAMTPEERKAFDRKTNRANREYRRKRYLEQKRLREPARLERKRIRREQALLRQKQRKAAAYATKKLADPNFLAKQREQGRAWRMANPERVKELKRLSYLRNKETYARYSRENRHRWRRSKRKTGAGKALDNLRKRLREVVRLPDTSSAGFCGCRPKELRRHLESMFLPGMSWENYGSAWHVDHVVPCASFDLSRAEDVRKCFHFSNLQPLWDRLNFAKSGRVLGAGELSYLLSQTPYPS